MLVALFGNLRPPWSFRLANAESATLQVYDVTGRVVSTREVASLGAGPHVISLESPGTIPPGLYLVSLTQGKHRLVARAVVIR